MTSEKTLEEVNNLLRIAKLDPDELLPMTHILNFSEDMLDPHEYKLVHVPKEFVDTMVLSGDDGGESLVIRGVPNDSAVLCTHSTTFEMKEAETSNTLLLTPNIGPPLQEDQRTLENVPVYGSFNRYFELTPIKPRLKRLEELLLKSPFSATNKSEAVGYSFVELLNNVQASESQLKEGLKSIHGVEINKKWYVLDEDYLMKTLTLIYNLIEEKSWKESTLQLEETISVLSENEPESTLRQIIDYYAPGEGDIRVMNEDLICRFYGKYILVSGTNFDLDEFMKIWQDSVPEGFQTSKHQLEGLALINNSTIRSFPETSLPHEIQSRLDVLFRVKEKWSMEEIKPYVVSLCTLKLNVKALLTKYARSSTQNGVKYFSAKHGK
ncbi:sister chromatid cohesion protein DCC1 [Lepeophtheirus salmonis]|uniref:sister chromatid cohesion protein DCC1 n=1 Tax=Lepeophtheirus salmonis TaxID=72036 RepID=UPI001AE900F3|nr:sister chromatid cohesion protein DCC1-like [Lepeophtheirus salmonis]